MRMVFIGASTLALTTARYLLKRGHEVVLIERDNAVIDELSQDLDCGFIRGDGSKPAILREAGPEDTHTLFCLTDSDQANILAALVGRSLGFERVVTKIDDAGFEHVCLELGLDDTIIPARTIARLLADMSEGRDPLELSTMFRVDARIFSFVVRDDQQVRLAELELPKQARVICLYRDDCFMLPDDETPLKVGDEVVLITARDSLKELKEKLSG